MTYTKRIQKLVGIFFLPFMLVACGEIASTPIEDDVVRSNETQSLPPTWTHTSPAHTKTKNPTLKSIPSHTQQSTITSTKTLLPEPSDTPIPTSELYSYSVEELMRNNGNCRLPCWWGITPGQTSWNVARQFLDHIGLVEKITRGNSTQPSSDTYIAYYWNPGTDDSNATIIGVVDDVVHTISVVPETSRYLPLYRLLSDYGTPSEVVIRQSFRQTGPILDYTLYSVVLLYWDNNFLAEFIFEDSSSEDPMIACLNFGPKLKTWSNVENWDLEWITNILGQSTSIPYVRIEEVTDHNPTTFHSEFRQYSTVPCFAMSN